MMAALRAESLIKSFGGVAATQDVSFSVASGSVVGLIGPNGAGKTTVLNLISGFYRPTSGKVWLGEREITGLNAEKVSTLGLRRTFQHNRLFKGLSALENVLVAHDPRQRISSSQRRRAAEDALSKVGMLDWKDRYPGEMPYASQRRVEIARAIVGNPSVLLLDEPAAGMHTDDRDRLIEIVRSIASTGVAILLIEHDMALVGELCDRVIVLNFGKLITEGSLSEVRDVPEVRQAYLGRSA